MRMTNKNCRHIEQEGGDHHARNDAMSCDDVERPAKHAFHLCLAVKRCCVSALASRNLSAKSTLALLL